MLFGVMEESSLAWPELPGRLWVRNIFKLSGHLESAPEGEAASVICPKVLHKEVP